MTPGATFFFGILAGAAAMLVVTQWMLNFASRKSVRRGLKQIERKP